MFARCSLLSARFFFTLWSVPDFLLDVHYFCSLLVNRYFLVIDCCFLLIACYSLLVGLYFLLVTFYSLLVTFYCFSFLSARCMLLVFLLVASYFFRYIFFFCISVYVLCIFNYTKKNRWPCSKLFIMTLLIILNRKMHVQKAQACQGLDIFRGEIFGLENFL